MRDPVFYFTLHPGDIMRTRILPGASIMLVASAFWRPEKQRFRIRRPPADHIGALVIDSGGFTAAKRWGSYPWTPEQYVEWLHQEARDAPLVWAASMDYACEREVNRATYRTNLDRIAATIENEARLRDIAPDITWLGVLQGNTLEERAEDVRRRLDAGLIHPLMGVGSICGRKAREAAAVLRFYSQALPGVGFHAFGLDVRTFDAAPDIYPAIASWDSYAWNWPRGRHSERPAFLRRKEQESLSQFCLRLAEEYDRHTVRPRLSRPRQLPLERVS